MAHAGPHRRPATRSSVSSCARPARFAMTLVTEQARVCQRLIRLVELGFPELGELFDDPACRTAREVLRVAPTAAVARKRRTSTLADANAGPGTGAWGDEGRAAQGRGSRQRSRCRARRGGRLRGRAAARPVRPARAPDHRGRGPRRLAARRRAGPTPPDHPRRRSRDRAALIAEIGDIWRFDDVDQLLAYAGVHPAERSSGRKGANPETSWHMSKAGNAHLRAAAYRMAVVGVTHNPVITAHYERKRAAGKSQDERPRPLHVQGPQPRLGRLAQRDRLRPRLGLTGLTRPYGI